MSEASRSQDALVGLRETVRVRRNQYAVLKAQRDELFAAWGEQHKKLLETYETSRAAMYESEALLRDEALWHFKITQETKPLPGIGIKHRTVLDYDPDQALAWAHKNSSWCLVLNEKMFEQIAKVSPMPFVQIRKEPFATIAKVLPEQDVSPE